MRAGFTICANNYLAHARVLKNSFNKHNPGIPFFIVVADKADNAINYESFGTGCVIFAQPILPLDLENLSLRFNISELCTTIKPFVFKHFFKEYKQVVYIDPDIKVYAPLLACWEALNKNTFVLTPHLMTPVDDGKTPSDLDTLRTGIFNLGFIGLSAGDELESFLKWWGERLLIYGFTNWDKGMFYDQIWANYIPVMFNRYHILKHPGYNVANWNWHERFVTIADGQLIINHQYPLVFFHFSSYKYTQPDSLCMYNTRFNQGNRPDLVPVFDSYHADLKAAGIDLLQTIKPYYQNRFMNQVMLEDKQRPFKLKLKRKLQRLIDQLL